MAPPAFSDIAKASNDLLNKDFYHGTASKVDVKSKAPNGVSFGVKGSNTHEGKTSGSIEGKVSDALAGLTVTETWTTANLLTTKVELDNQIAKGLKVEGLADFKPVDKHFDAKLNLHFKQPNLTGRAFFNLLKGPTANIDAVLGHEGFLVGVEAGYDVQKASITKYAAAIGYAAPQWSAAVTATNSLSNFAASYYHKVNAEVEAGAKAIWDQKHGDHVGLELAAKYRLDPTSFAKAKVNDKGIAALAYNLKVSRGFTFGIGTSLDTKKLNEGAGSHKIGASFEFEG